MSTEQVAKIAVIVAVVTLDLGIAEGTVMEVTVVDMAEVTGASAVVEDLVMRSRKANVVSVIDADTHTKVEAAIEAMV